MLKAYLKIWNREVFVNVNQAGEEMHKKILELDARDDKNELDDFEREERRILLVEQSQKFFKQKVVLYEKAHVKWLKQGDLNSKFFHSTVKWRRARNGINRVFENGHWCEEGCG